MPAVVLHDPLTLGRLIRDARRGLGLAQHEVAARSGVRQATVSDIERGTAASSLDTVLRVMSAVDLELVVRPRSPSPGTPWE